MVTSVWPCCVRNLAKFAKKLNFRSDNFAIFFCRSNFFSFFFLLRSFHIFLTRRSNSVLRFPSIRTSSKSFLEGFFERINFAKPRRGRRRRRRQLGRHVKIETLRLVELRILLAEFCWLPRSASASTLASASMLASASTIASASTLRFRCLLRLPRSLRLTRKRTGN